jgi:DNA-binding SARP family transcriptional activator/tetratricopeptide (TPR) repeat protein
MEIELKILGPPELLAGGQRGTSISPQLWCVLVSLLMTPNVPVSTEVLIDRLWGDDPPPKARSTIRSYISRLDRALPQAGRDAIRISRQARSYALAVDSDAVDLHRFRSLRRQSEAIGESGETRQAATLLRQAEALWRGMALAGLPGGWIGRMRDSLEEELRSVTARRIELELALGRHAQLLAELAELSDKYPLDEVLAGHRMIALFRSGRQADALSVYRETRARLVAVGIEPGLVLAQLHQRILRHDPDLAVTPAYRRASRQPQPNTLPPDIGDFVGRSTEIALLAEDTGPPDGCPKTWIVEGMGGVGKTSLAVHAARRMAQRFPDAQLYLDFRAHDQLREPLDPADALGGLLTMLDVPAIRMHGTLSERAELWRGELASRRAVIILDDVIGPDQVRPLLPREGDCLVIVTTRRRHPRWAGVRRLTLQVLPEDDAVTLFTQVGGRPAERDPDHAARVARLCGCLPLAIRIAASRLRSGAVPSLPDLLDELHEPDIGQAEDVSHQVQAAFELSYRQLTANDRRFFRYLGVSPCLDVSPASAAAICGWTQTEAQAALGTLTSHYLLEEMPQGRFGFHDLVRAFAAARSASEDAEAEARLAVGRLADYYLRAVSHANMVLHGGEDGTPVAARAWLESEWGNALRVAQACGRHERKRRCADLVHALGEFLETGGHWDAALAAHTMALQACRDLGDLPGVARASFDFSLTALRTGQSEAALRHATEAATVFSTLGDRRGQAAALDRVGIIHRNTARFRDALAHHQEAMDIYRDAGDPAGIAKALRHAAGALAELGRHAEEMSCLREALEICCQIDDLRGQAITLNNMGAAEERHGYHRDAMRSYQASLDIFSRIGGRQSLAILDNNIGLLHQYKGNYRAAIAIYRKVLAVYRSIGDLQHQALVLADIGSAYQSMDRFDEALAHYEQAASLGETAGDHHVSVKALCGIADAHLGAGRLSVALDSYQRVAELAGGIDALYLRAKGLNGIAEILLRTQGAGAARIYWREAHDIFAQLGVPEATIIAIRLQALDAPVP